MGARILKDKLKRLPIHPSFILLFLWFVFTQNIHSFFLFCSVVLTHEFGHYYMAKRLGYKLDSFFLAPYGVCLNYKESAFEERDEVLIALAGPFVNILLCVVAVAVWWVFPVSYNYTQEFVFQSAMLGLFNLLPCYPLDGGRIFVGTVSKFSSRKRAVKISIIINFLISALLLTMFAISLFYNFNPSFCFCAVFLILGIIDGKSESKYKPIAIYKKKTKNFSKPFFYMIKDDVTLAQALKRIELNRFTIFVLESEDGKVRMFDENKIKLLSIKFSLDTKFKDIIG